MRRREPDVHADYPFIGAGKRYETVEEWLQVCDVRRERRRRLLDRIERDDLSAEGDG